MPNAARTRRLPTALAALGILGALALVVAGSARPVAPSPLASGSVVTLAVSPSPSPSLESSPDPTTDVFASDSPAPSGSASPSPSPTRATSTGKAVTTRVVIAALGIDLAVVKSPPADVYPYCNVAMYLGSPLGQPGSKRATYIFAHARDGMFGPIYELTMVKRTPNNMKGMLVDVYTSDSMRHTYRIAKVLPHQLSLKAPFAVRSDQLWLQTSEGPRGTPGKTQVVANPVSVTPADHAASHPRAQRVRCG